MHHRPGCGASTLFLLRALERARTSAPCRSPTFVVSWPQYDSLLNRKDLSEERRSRSCTLSSRYTRPFGHRSNVLEISITQPLPRCRYVRSLPNSLRTYPDTAFLVTPACRCAQEPGDEAEGERAPRH
eukprot:5879599-Pleurochrysis_carterae.AAC.1